VVICDRYWQDTAIDFKLNFPQEDVQQWWLWKLLVFMTPLPDAAFLLLVPVEESIARSKLKNEPFPDSPEVLRGRLELYEAMATKNYWNVLDGRREISSLSDEIISIVKSVGRK
jgi:thymidylate kinase